MVLKIFGNTFEISLLAYLSFSFQYFPKDPGDPFFSLFFPFGPDMCISDPEMHISVVPRPSLIILTRKKSVTQLSHLLNLDEEDGRDRVVRWECGNVHPISPH